MKDESSADGNEESLRRLQASSTVDIENTRSYEDKMLMQFLKQEKREEEMFGKDPSTSKELQEVLIESLSQSQKGALSQPHGEGIEKQRITKPPRIKLTPILPMTAHVESFANIHRLTSSPKRTQKKRKYEEEQEDDQMPRTLPAHPSSMMN